MPKWRWRGEEISKYLLHETMLNSSYEDTAKARSGSRRSCGGGGYSKTKPQRTEGRGAKHIQNLPKEGR